MSEHKHRKVIENMMQLSFISECREQALQYAIECMDAMAKAKDCLPEKREEAICGCTFAEGCGCQVFDYNHCLDEVQPVFQKQQQRIAELEKEVERLKNAIKFCSGSCHAVLDKGESHE